MKVGGGVYIYNMDSWWSVEVKRIFLVDNNSFILEIDRE